MRSVDAMRAPHGPSHGPGPVRRAYAATPSVNREAFRGVVTRATAYAADTYTSTHARLRRVRGSAVGLPGARCGRRSTGWACVAADADRVTGTNSERRRVSYSLDLADYVPACDGCRAATDAERQAVAALALSPIRKPERSARLPPAPVATPQLLFGPSPTDPTRPAGRCHDDDIGATPTDP